MMSPELPRVSTLTEDWEFAPFNTAVGGHGVLTFDSSSSSSIRIYADSGKTSQISSGMYLDANVGYTFYVEAVSPGQADITVRMFGVPSWPGGSNEHTVTVGVPVFDLSVDGDTDLNDTLPDGTPDGVENYLPGYEGSTPVLYTTNPGYHPQKMRLVVEGLPGNYAVWFSITSGVPGTPYLIACL